MRHDLAMPKVLHLIDAQTPADLLDQLSLLAGPRDQIVSLGPPPSGQFALPVRIVHSPPLAVWRSPLKGTGGYNLVHAWSPRAAKLGQGLAQRHGCFLVASLHCLASLPDMEKMVEFAAGMEAVIVPTQCARQAAIALGAPQDRVYVLPPPARASKDPSARQRVRESLGISMQDTLLAAPGELVRDSGHKYAPWAHAILRQIRPDIRLIIPGRGPNLERVRFFVGTTGYGSEVFLTEGRLDEAEVLAASDMALYFPVCDGGVGSLAGAMAAGLPIAASNTPDAAEMAADGRTALLVKPQDPREASAAVLKLLEEPQLARQLAAAAKARADELFDPAVVRAKLVEIYKIIRSR